MSTGLGALVLTGRTTLNDCCELLEPDAMCLEHERLIDLGNIIGFLKYTDPTLKNLLERAKQNDGNALFTGSLILLSGFDLAPIDEIEAVEWARRGALIKHPACAVLYGLHLDSGYENRRRRDAEQYIIMGKKWLLDATRDQTHPWALTLRAEVEARGLGGFRPSKVNAARLLESAAKLGDASAQYRCGVNYDEQSRRTGQQKDQNAVMAFGLIESAAKQGHAPAQRLLSIYLTNGFGTEENPDKSLEWLFKAANQHYPLAALEAGYWCTEQGKCAKPDSDEAKKWSDEIIKWYRLAAKNGLPWAEIAIAQCYDFGIGVEENKAMAYSMYYALANRNGKTFLTQHPSPQGRHFVKSRMAALRGNTTSTEKIGQQLFMSWGEDEITISEIPRHALRRKTILERKS
jgi:TPR repeat protein